MEAEKNLPQQDSTSQSCTFCNVHTTNPGRCCERCLRELAGLVVGVRKAYIN